MSMSVVVIDCGATRLLRGYVGSVIRGARGVDCRIVMISGSSYSGSVSLLCRGFS